MKDRSQENEDWTARWEPPEPPRGPLRLAGVPWAQATTNSSIYPAQRTGPPPAVWAIAVLLLILAGLLYFLNGGAGSVT